MKLLIVRHAIAMERSDYQLAARSPAAPSGEADADDNLRPLTLEGLRKMKKAAKGLARVVERPRRLATSPLTRAVQTAEILRDAWEGLDIETCEFLRPDSKFPAFAKWLNGQKSADADDGLIVVVGHEPHLSKLISWFLKSTSAGLQPTAMIELKKGGACLLEFSGPVAKGQAVLKWLVLPSQLRMMAR